MNKAKIVIITKYVAYGLVLLALYVLQTTPGLFVIFGSKPMLVVPAAIAIAMHEGEFVGGFYGAFAGLLCDMSSSLLFGFNGFLLTFFCVVAGLLVTHFMHDNIWNAMLFTLVTTLAIGSLEFLFGYGMWGLPNVSIIYTHSTLPLIAYTTVVAPLMFWPVRLIYRRARRAVEN